MKNQLLLFLPFFIVACNSKHEPVKDTLIIKNDTSNTLSKTQTYFKKHINNRNPSKSVGTVSNGELLNGKLMPFEGENFEYFDKTSYLAGKGFTHSTVKKIVLTTYSELANKFTERRFKIMECSNQHGGKISPHRTHQNGTSVDFMMPKLKNGIPYYGLDNFGIGHYLLSFDDKGRFSMNNDISIDFEMVAQHILLLERNAQLEGYKIKKVIIKIEFKDELFATPSGQKLKKSEIYIVRNLSPLINSLHDEHYHIDFDQK
jgi:penicillin-insensitive murein endopeptidase